MALGLGAEHHPDDALLLPIDTATAIQGQTATEADRGHRREEKTCHVMIYLGRSRLETQEITEKSEAIEMIEIAAITLPLGVLHLRGIGIVVRFR